MDEQEIIGRTFAIIDEKLQSASIAQVGGWPHYLQDNASSLGEFVFQIDSEYKANWMWGDAGIAYFFKDETESWFMDWDSL